MRTALDTDILLYASGMYDRARQQSAIETIDKIPAGDLVVPAQALAEFGYVLRTRQRATAQEVREAVERWAGIALVAPTTQDTVLAATALSAAHQVSMFNAIILVSAAESRCHLLLSEDIHHGFTWAGVTVVNPFA